jgi:hypothetical protein
MQEAEGEKGRRRACSLTPHKKKEGGGVLKRVNENNLQGTKEVTIWQGTIAWIMAEVGGLGCQLQDM